jgi:hypothetical protein
MKVGAAGQVVALVFLALCSTMLGVHGVVQAGTTDVGTSEVMFSIGKAIEVVSWPTFSIALDSDGTPGQAAVSDVLSFTVKSNATWSLQIQSDGEDGKLREYNLTESVYVEDGKTSQNSLEWGLTPDGAWYPISDVPGTVFSSQPATGDAGTTVSMYVRYVPGFNDTPLPSGFVYRAVLTYTATVGY